MSYTKKKILSEANKVLESRYLRNKFILSEQEKNYIDMANKKLSDLGLSFNLSEYFKQAPVTDEDYLCTPSTGEEKKDTILNAVSSWLDNNMDNKGIIDIKLKELIKLIKTVGSNKMNTELSEQLGVDSIMFGNTSISKEDILDIGNDLIFILVMSSVHPKPETKITRKFCVK
jgi:hypothetical protein